MTRTPVQQRRDVVLLLEAPLDRAYLEQWAAGLGLDGFLKEVASELGEGERRRESCRRFYGDALAQAAFPAPVAG